MRALALANLRFWPTVAPVMARELRRWEQPAGAIGDPALAGLALGKLADERFNAEVAATLATLAPRDRRTDVTGAIVALELLFDYLDGRTEQTSDDPLAEGERLFDPFLAAVDADRPSDGPAGAAGAPKPDDLGYLQALAQRTRGALLGLPAWEAVGDVAGAAARRCAQAQIRVHAGATLGDGQLERWAGDHSEGERLGWREYAAGCASSVLSVHALIAAAADPATTAAEAQAIDRTYLAIAGVITLLDSLVDYSADSAQNRLGFMRLFGSPDELTASAVTLTREALERAHDAPNGAHHAMTLAGAIAYYTSHPGARDRHARAGVRELRAQTSPAVWPALGVMLGWRAAKRARSTIARAIHPLSRRRRWTRRGLE